jgi:hypothetical protein
MSFTYDSGMSSCGFWWRVHLLSHAGSKSQQVEMVNGNKGGTDLASLVGFNEQFGDIFSL